MNYRVLAVSALAAFLVGLANVGSAETRDPVPLAPVTPWQLSRDEHRCALARSFGSKDDPFLLRFERFAPGDAFDILLTGTAFKGVVQAGGMRIAFGEGGFNGMSDGAFIGTNDKKVPSLLMTSSLAAEAQPADQDGADKPVVTSEREQAVTSISLAWGAKAVRLDTGSLGKPFAALRTCTDNLVRSWGLDPDQQASLRSKPVPSKKTLNGFSGFYGPRLIVPGGWAWARLRLLVDADGRPHDCMVQRVSSGKDLGGFACDVMLKHGNYTPAVDAQGNKVASYFSTKVTWLAR